MNVHGLLLPGILLSSFVTGLVIFFLKEEHHRLRTWLNLLGAGVKSRASLPVPQRAEADA